VRKLTDVKDPKLTKYTNLMQVEFDRNFNSALKIPTNISHLTLGMSFNKPIVFPHNIIYLDCGCAFNQRILYFPRNLIHLSLGYSFNHQIPILPKTLIYLRFGDRFNQIISHLPSTLKVFVTGRNFNKKLPALPCITRLKIGYGYNHELLLPDSILHLDWRSCRKISMLPSKLKYFRSHTSQYIKDIPSSITHMTIDYDFSCDIISMPHNLTNLDITIYCSEDDFDEKMIRKFHKQLRFPNGLKHLEWNCVLHTVHMPELP
jgi:hypothetical protein